MSSKRMTFLATITIRSKKTLCLSTNVYNTPSVAALGIAAHETGHAIQHAKSYAPLKARMTIVPVTQIASQMLPLVIFGGLFFHITGLITLGIWCYAILLVFQLITLPVEFDASRRAKIILKKWESSSRARKPRA